MKRELGVCYYPEHWPEVQWPVDAQRMFDMGLRWVRIGEFAWSRLEPQPDQLHFDWLDRAIAVLGQAGLKVVLGTPTATPPRWLLDKHPDMLAEDAQGNPRGFGSRRHYCFSHEGYRQEALRIVTLLAKRYGDHPAIAAWQIDNEYGCHDTVVSYSAAAKQAFQHWLQQRYSRVEVLNTAWGNVFWSMEYQSFAQIDLPVQTVTEANPAHVMDFRRFSSDQVVLFNRLQVAALREQTQVPLLHNYMGRICEFDHWQVGADLDIATWDSYPIGFLSDRLEASEAHKATYLRQGDPDFQAFHHDLYRGIGRGRWWVMEQQPGPVNWAPFNPAPLPGMVRVWTWEAFAHGAEVVSYFRWRQAPFAQEQMHAGLLRPDASEAEAVSEIQQVVAELDQFPEVTHVPGHVAIVFDYASAWAWETQPQGADFNYFRLVFSFYQALRKLGLNIDIIAADTNDLSRWPLVFIPAVMTLSDPLKNALNQYQGRAILGPRTDSKTVNFSIPASLPPTLTTLETQVLRVESLPPNSSMALETGGHLVHWREFLHTKAQVLSRTDDQQPFWVRSGHLDYWGGWPNAHALESLLMILCKESNIPYQTMPEGVRVRHLDGYSIWIDYLQQQVKWTRTTP